MDGFIGKLYIIDEANPEWLTFDNQIDVMSWDANIGGVIPQADMSEIATMQGDFEVSTKESGSHFDQNGNKIIDSEIVTGKVNIGIDNAVSGTLINNYQGVPTSFALVSEDLACGDYVQNAVLNFAQTAKIGSLILSEMSFEFTQAVNTPEANTRRRQFTISNYSA